MKQNPIKTVVITGAEGALGRKVVASFADAGWKVFATYHRSLHADIQHEKRAEWVQMDVSDSASVKQAVADVKEQAGQIGALIHCAGGFRFAQVEKTSDADLDFLFDVNLKSAFLLLRELLPGMKEAGFGRIVLVSSRATSSPPAGMSAYAASKAGLNALVASVAEEVKSSGININAVMPTVIDTPANREAMPKADFSQWVSPEALAKIVLSLCEELGDPVNGALIPVAGRL